MSAHTPLTSHAGPKARLGGAVLVALAAMLFKLSFIDPYRDAERQSEHVSSSAILIALPMFFALGIALLAFGEGAIAWMKRYENRTDGRPSPVRRVVIGVAIAAGLALYAWQQQRLNGLGYH